VRIKGVDASGNSEQNVSEGEKDSSASQSQNYKVLSLVDGLEEAILSGSEKELVPVGGSRSRLVRSVTDTTSGNQDVVVHEIGSSSSDSSRDCSSNEVPHFSRTIESVFRVQVPHVSRTIPAAFRVPTLGGNFLRT
jgi:hypothetical protein